MVRKRVATKRENSNGGRRKTQARAIGAMMSAVMILCRSTSNLEIAQRSKVASAAIEILCYPDTKSSYCER